MSSSEWNRILVIDDDKILHDAFRAVLSPTRIDTASLDALESALFDEPATAASASAETLFQVDFAEQGQQGHQLVERALADGKPYAMAFVDMRMPPGWDGVETIEHLWKADPDLEVVNCTAFSDHSWDKIIERLGQTHRLLLLRKPFDKAEVWQLATAQSRKRAAENAAKLRQLEVESANVRLTAEIAARVKAEDELKHDALHDALTDLPNRILMSDRLQRCIERARRSPDYKYAVLFLDLDDFKLINDTLGHTIGDQLLIEVGKRLGTCLRAVDTASRLEAHTPARLGGDEFVVLLDGLRSADDALLVAERVRSTISQKLIIAGNEVVVTTSIGVAHGNPEYELPDDILRDADAALYHSKASTDGCIGVFDAGMRKGAVDRLKLGNALRTAIERHELRLMFQPIVSLESGEIQSFESLARWQHPELGSIDPAQFIPLAEDLGLIREIGQWVLSESCKQLRIWRDQYPNRKELSISVNVAPKQIGAADFVSICAAAIRDAGIEGQHLSIEITESTLIHDAEAAKTTLDQLRALGVKAYLDDFGTGYASLSYLNDLPFDAIKIDRSFVAGIQLDGKHANTIMAIQTLARNRRMSVIAEGIETLEQLVTLQALDCTSGQGFYLSRPLEAAAAGALLKQDRLNGISVKTVAA